MDGLMPSIIPKCIQFHCNCWSGQKANNFAVYFPRTEMGADWPIDACPERRPRTPWSRFSHWNDSWGACMYQSNSLFIWSRSYSVLLPLWRLPLATMAVPRSQHHRCFYMVEGDRGNWWVECSYNLANLWIFNDRQTKIDWTKEVQC